MIKSLFKGALIGPVSSLFVGAAAAATVVVAWVLATGTWDDSAPWVDTEFWKDNA